MGELKSVILVFSLFVVYVDGYLTCGKECSIENGKIIVENSQDIVFTYYIDNSQFTLVSIFFDGKLALSATTTTVSLSANRDQRFRVSGNTVRKTADTYTFSFTFSRFEYTDVNKILSYTTKVNNRNEIKTLRLEVFGGPKTCGPVKGTMTADEYSKDDLLWMICGRPEPRVTAQIRGTYFRVDKRVLSDHTYIFTVKLNQLKRWQCGSKLRLEASGRKRLRHDVDMIVAFTPPKMYDFDAKYDAVKDCANLYWKRIEAGTCPVKYFIRYDNEFDSRPADVYETTLLKYTKCGPEIGYNFSIKAVVNGVSGPYTDSVGREGTGRILGDADAISWYYILIIVIGAIILIIIVLILCLRCKRSKTSTKDIVKTNSIELYLEEAQRKQNGGVSRDNNNGHVSKEARKNQSRKQSKLKFGGKKKEKSARQPVFAINGDTDDFKSLSEIERGEAKAKAERSTKPKGDETSFRVTFQNIHQNSVKLYWKDYKGNEKFCQKINPGKDHHVIAFMEYSYIARDTRTNRLIFFRKDHQFDVVFKGPEFGTEIGGVNTIIISGTPELNFTNGVVNENFEGDDDDDRSVGSSGIAEPPPPPVNLIYAEIVPEPSLKTFNPRKDEDKTTRRPSIKTSSTKDSTSITPTFGENDHEVIL